MANAIEVILEQLKYQNTVQCTVVLLPKGTVKRPQNCITISFLVLKCVTYL